MGTNITGIGNANAIGFKSRVTGGTYFPPKLKDALIGVWSAYGKSNNSTDRNIIKNKIKDRGGDFVISNAAFKLNSGFGKYEEDFTTWLRSNKIINFDDKSFKFNTNESWVLFRLYKSQIDADFSLYKGQRDNYDALKAEIDNLKCQVAVNTAVRPYQDKLIQCEIEKAFTAGINYVDRKTCNVIYGVTVLPNEPTTTGLVGRNANGCLPCGMSQTTPAPAA